MVQFFMVDFLEIPGRIWVKVMKNFDKNPQEVLKTSFYDKYDAFLVRRCQEPIKWRIYSITVALFNPYMPSVTYKLR